MSQLKDSEAQKVNFPLSSLFVLFRPLTDWPIVNETHPHWGGPFAFLSLPIQMLTLTRNIIIDTPRILLTEYLGILPHSEGST